MHSPEQLPSATLHRKHATFHNQNCLKHAASDTQQHYDGDTVTYFQIVIRNIVSALIMDKYNDTNLLQINLSQSRFSTKHLLQMAWMPLSPLLILSGSPRKQAWVVRECRTPAYYDDFAFLRHSDNTVFCTIQVYFIYVCISVYNLHSKHTNKHMHKFTAKKV